MNGGYQEENDQRVDFLGVPVDLLSREQTVDIAIDAMSNRGSVYHVALNAAKFVKMRKDPDLSNDVTDADIVGLDGMGIVFALKLFGVRDAERVPGVDLMFSLLEQCATRGFRPYILGARQDALDRAEMAAKERWPGLQIAGSRDGYFTSEMEAKVVDGIRASKADCLFVAMPTPRKERFLHRYRHELEVPFIMGVGGSVDVLAGLVSRAPDWMQRTGLEWLHRLLQEPRKMAWRYISTNSAFVWIVVRAWLAQMRGQPAVRPLVQVDQG